MSYRLGVDLGTTFVAAARCGRSPVEMVTLGDRTVVMPSVVHVGADGDVLVGEAADRRAVSSPERVARQFKRRLGEPTPMRLGDATHTAVELSAMLLSEVLTRVGRIEGGPPAEVVLTHPANWGPSRRRCFEEVPGLAGVSGVRMLTEPEAAALHYASARELAVDSTVAVYDLGGGTFDAAVVRRTADGVATLGTPEGLERLGGIDFDEAVFAFVDHACDGALARLDSGDPKRASALNRLRQDCVQAKEALSADTETVVPVLLPGRQFDVRITRSEFEGLIRAQVESTIAALSRALGAAGVAAEELNAVLLVGGSSRIPLISRMVSEELGRPILVDTHPKYAVALGAATASAPASASAASSPVRPAPAKPPARDPGRPVPKPLTWDPAALDEEVRAAVRRLPTPRRTLAARLTGIAALLGALIALIVAPSAPSFWPNGAVAPAPSPPAPPAIPVGDPRLVDYCAFLNPAEFAGFGRVFAGPRIEGFFNQCRLHLYPHTGGKVAVAVSFVANLRWITGGRERRGDLIVVRPDAAGPDCVRNIELPEDVSVVIRAMVTGGPTDTCAITDGTTESVVRVLSERGVPHLPAAGDANSLRAQDACSVLDEPTLRRVPGLDPGRRTGAFGGWGCTWGNNRYAGNSQLPAVDVFFQWGTPLSGANGERVRLAGRDVYVRASDDGEAGCFARVVHRDQPLDGQRAQEIVVTAVYAALPEAERCRLAREMATTVAARLPPP